MSTTGLDKPNDATVEHSAAAHPDPQAEPSVEWGWHGEFPRATRIAGWSTVIILLLMLIGNHEGNIENLWLVGLAALLVGILVAGIIRRRRSARRH